MTEIMGCVGAWTCLKAHGSRRLVDRFSWCDCFVSISSESYSMLDGTCTYLFVAQ